MIKIAVAQIFCIDGDREGNLIRIENAIIQAKQYNAELITFPESCILGWINPIAHQKSFAIPGEDSSKISEWAKKYKIHICIGLDEKVGNLLFGSAILVDDKGEIILKHQKINVLPHLMQPPYTAGNQINIIQTQFGKIGILICADSFQENLLLRMKEKQPDLLLIPYGWAEESKNWPDHGKELIKVVQHASITLNCPIIGTNLVGQISQGIWAGRIYGGQSVVCNAVGEIIKTGKDRDSEVMIIDLILDNHQKNTILFFI